MGNVDIYSIQIDIETLYNLYILYIYKYIGIIIKISIFVR